MMITQKPRTTTFLVIGAVLTFNMVCLLVALAVENRIGLHPEAMYRDPNAVADQSFLVGWFSSIGVISWAASAGIALFVWATARGNQYSHASFLFMGLFSMIVGFDDALMLHEGLLPRLGIPFEPFALAYAVLLGLFLVNWFIETGGEHWPLPALAVLGLGASFVVDAVDDMGILGYHTFLLDDILKFLGLTSWLAFVVSFGWRSTR